HNTDHSMRNIVEVDLLADDVCIRIEQSTPHGIAQDGHLLMSCGLIFCTEAATHCRAGPQYGKQICAYHWRWKALPDSRLVKIDLRWVVEANRSQGFAFGPPLLDIRIRTPERQTLYGINGCGHKFVGAIKRKPTEQGCVNHREHCGVG